MKKKVSERVNQHVAAVKNKRKNEHCNDNNHSIYLNYLKFKIRIFVLADSWIFFSQITVLMLSTEVFHIKKDIPLLLTL